MNANVDSEVRSFSKQNQHFRSLLQSKGINIDEESVELPSCSRFASDAWESIDSAGSTEASKTQGRRSSWTPNSKRDQLLKEILDRSDQEIDPASKYLIEQSQKLLLRDVRPFQ